jgi:hypothetical protein
VNSGVGVNFESGAVIMYFIVDAGTLIQSKGNRSETTAVQCQLSANFFGADVPKNATIYKDFCLLGCNAA